LYGCVRLAHDSYDKLKKTEKKDLLKAQRITAVPHLLVSIVGMESEDKVLLVFAAQQSAGNWP
jgi:hypothetical protein